MLVALGVAAHAWQACGDVADPQKVEPGARNAPAEENTNPVMGPVLRNERSAVARVIGRYA